jgi:hypothetical protein
MYDLLGSLFIGFIRGRKDMRVAFTAFLLSIVINMFFMGSQGYAQKSVENNKCGSNVESCYMEINIKVYLKDSTGQKAEGDVEYSVNKVEIMQQGGSPSRTPASQIPNNKGRQPWKHTDVVPNGFITNGPYFAYGSPGCAYYFWAGTWYYVCG